MSAESIRQAELIDQLHASRWFSGIDASLWHEQASGLAEEKLAVGDVLFRQGDPGDAFYLVMKGHLRVSLFTGEGSETVLNEVGANELIGEIQVLTGGNRTATVYASTDAAVIRIDAHVFDAITRQSPEFLRKVVETNRRRLNRSLLVKILQDEFGRLPKRLIRFIEVHAVWLDLSRNEILFSEGDMADHLYLVLQGQLESKPDHATLLQAGMTRLGRGEVVGMSALLAGSPHRMTLRASRDTKLVGLPKKTFHRLAASHPSIGVTVARMMARKSEKSRSAQPAVAFAQSQSKSLALVAANDGIDLTGFAIRLTDALSEFGQSLHLHRDNLESLSGLRINFDGARDDPSQLRLGGWLDEKEFAHRFILYQCDTGTTAWTRKCLRQADHVVVVCSAGQQPASTRVAELLLYAGEQDMADVTTLVVVHSDGGKRPRDTINLLSALGLRRHQHLRWDDKRDFARIARFFNGTAVGVVLGGGGARGLAHIGVLRALEEHDIPVDIIGGTSFGALIAAQFAFGYDPEGLVELNRHNFLVEKPLNDLTLPFFGLIVGDRGEMIGNKSLEGSRIEDLWINFFAISANLSTAQQVVHQQGPAIRAVRASMAIPGVFVPVVRDNDLLVDGGVLNNVPVDVMRRLGGGRVIGINVSPNKDISVEVTGGRLPSARQMVWNRLNPRARPPEVPGLFEILMRSSTLGSVQNTASARLQSDLYIEPPLDRFGTFDLSQLDDIVEAGYRQACLQLESFSLV